jgi:hypothetical protein
MEACIPKYVARYVFLLVIVYSNINGFANNTQLHVHNKMHKTWQAQFDVVDAICNGSI